MLRVKTSEKGEIEKYKARVVAKGYKQMEGVDYDGTIVPTVRFESIRTLIAMRVAEGWNFNQMDFLTLFPYVDPDEENFVEIPEGVTIVEGMV